MAAESRPECSVFDHCREESETWATFYSLACLCHPGQGGHREEMEGLCAQARAALGDSWPEHWTGAAGVPNLFDLFCTATGADNPFGQSIAAGGQFDRVPAGGEPAGFRYGTMAYAPLAPTLGSMELVFSAAAESKPSRWSLT